MSSNPDIEFITAFGARVRELRMERGWSMREFAEMCDTEYSQIARIETAKINTSVGMVGRIAKALGVSAMTLFDF